MTEGFNSGELSTALLAGLAIEADKLAEAGQHLAGAFRFSRQLRFVIGFGAALLLVTLASMGVLLWVAFTNLHNGDAIRSCTNPKGDCYERSQKATATAVQDIVSAVNAHSDLVLIATIECTRDQPPAVDLVACLRAKGVR